MLPYLPRIPTKLLTDNGPEFISADFSSFLQTNGIKHQLPTPYHPTSNGVCERVKCTIQEFLRSLVQNGDNWDDHLSTAVITYNNTRHSELSMSPSQFLLTKTHQIDYSNLLPLND